MSLDLESRLQAIWDKYTTQRLAERHALETAKRAQEDLNEFNNKRAAAGLQPVSEHYGSGQFHSLLNHAQIVYPSIPPPRTWREDMSDAMLACIHAHFDK
jgi:hypothetical protein